MDGIISGGILITDCSRQLLTRLPMTPNSWQSDLWLRAGSSDLFLMNKIWQKWWVVTSVIELLKTVTSVLLTLSLLLATSPVLSLAYSDEEGCCVVRCSRTITKKKIKKKKEKRYALGRGLCGKELMEEELARNGSRKWILPTTTSEWARKWILPSQALRWLQLVKDPKPEDPAKLYFDSCPRDKCCEINVCCCKLLHCRVTCNVATPN